MGYARYLLGLEIARSTEGIYVNQRKYAFDLLTDVGLLGAKAVVTPFPKALKLSHEDAGEVPDPDRYRRLGDRLL